MNLEQGGDVVDRSGDDEEEPRPEAQVGDEIVRAGNQHRFRDHHPFGFARRTCRVEHVPDIIGESTGIHLRLDGVEFLLRGLLAERYGNGLQIMDGAINDEKTEILGIPEDVRPVRLQTFRPQFLRLDQDGLPKFPVGNLLLALYGRHRVGRRLRDVLDPRFHRALGLHHLDDVVETLEIARRHVFGPQLDVIFVIQHVQDGRDAQGVQARKQEIGFEVHGGQHFAQKVLDLFSHKVIIL